MIADGKAFSKNPNFSTDSKGAAGVFGPWRRVGEDRGNRVTWTRGAFRRRGAPGAWGGCPVAGERRRGVGAGGLAGRGRDWLRGQCVRGSLTKWQFAARSFRDAYAAHHVWDRSIRSRPGRDRGDGGRADAGRRRG